MRLNKLVLILMTIILGASVIVAQGDKPKSPRGEAATQVGDKWITIDYGRPILRGRRDVFGSGESYGQKMYAGAPVWRAGANKSTRFMTEADLMFGDKKLPAGEYSVFIELKEAGWTLIFSNYKAKDSGRAPGDGIWGAYGYETAKDVIRVPMKVASLPNVVDQLTYLFMDVTETGGTLNIIWDNVIGGADFKVASKKE